MKDLLKHVGMCVVSGFATQIGYMLAQKLVDNYYDNKNKRPIGFSVR